MICSSEMMPHFCGTAFDDINSLFRTVSCGQAYRDPIDPIAARNLKKTNIFTPR